MRAKTATKEIRDILDSAVDFDEMVDELEQKAGLTPVSLTRQGAVKHAISTGSLTFDLITGGGYIPGRFWIFKGFEASGKSTWCYFSLREAIKQGVPIIFLDYEGSTDTSYIERIVGYCIEELFGVRDKKTKKYIVKPIIRYYQPDVGERGFRFVHRILKKLPDKVMVEGEWYFVYNSREWAGTLKKSKIKYKSKGGKCYVKTTGKAQALVFVDSFAAMFPESRDDDDEASPMAKLARMFSDNLPTIKTRLAPKKVTLIATNQVRLKPMAWGNPEYMVGGEALKYYSDTRVDVRAISIPHGKGAVEEEDCWDEVGVDKYRYVKLTVEKNKSFSPFRKATLRIWFENKGRPGYGFDPVYDVYQYLIETGQLEEEKNIEITLPGPWKDVEWDFMELKELILNPDKLGVYKKFELEDDRVEKALASLAKAKTDTLKKKLKRKARRIAAEVLDIQAVCRAQFEDNTAFEYYFNTKAGVGKEGLMAIEFNKKVCGNCCFSDIREEFEGCKSHYRGDNTLACAYWEPTDKDMEEKISAKKKTKKKKGKK